MQLVQPAQVATAVAWGLHARGRGCTAVTNENGAVRVDDAADRVEARPPGS